MNNHPIQFLIACMIFVTIGLICGFSVASLYPDSKNTHEEEHDEHDHHTDEKKIKVSPQVEASLGIQIHEIEVSNYTSYKNIRTTVTETPLALNVIKAPYSGIVQNIKVTHGELVPSNFVAITLIRDAIPRPELKLTSFLLSPEQKLIGMNLSDFESIANKSVGQQQIALWKQALIRTGNWTKTSDQLLSILPKGLQDLSYTTAVIGELTANGSLSLEFLDLFESMPDANKSFFEICRLSLDGQSVEYIKHLLLLGGLNAIVEIKVPNFAEDYDIGEILIKSGDRVSAGQHLINIYDYHQIHLEVNVIGSEITLLENILKNDLTLFAEPIATGSGIRLENLKIRSIQSHNDGGASVHLEIIKNEAFVTKNATTSFRTWLARPGSKYLLKVPQAIYKDVYVVNSQSVVEDGLEKMVFLKDGDSYKPANVLELFRDEQSVILSQDSDLFPGDPVVMNGAFGLNLALKAQSGGPVDPHAGHNH